ncbi:MAG: type IV pilus twitching motility protein PilT [Armatimonadota bacterium]|nr:type IV pilus twitching motility protein PilT [Armatimonadota bacterium]MDR7404270.1 type IV pilus twitching motility protein PilT [Armatimonadota bacterium]
MEIRDLLAVARERQASDLHIKVGNHPILRVNGRLLPLTDLPVLDAASARALVEAMMTDEQKAHFRKHLELDFAYSLPGVSRFRVNVYQQRGSIGAAVRAIPTGVPTLEDLGLPEVVRRLAGLPRGLVLVTGPTGSGKSTTLAAMIHHINQTRAVHIVTIEDPIEYLHKDIRSVINQREVGMDTHSFANALRHVLRQDPDVILIGEMRDLETISTAVTAAETGHLVLATLHTQSAAQTVDRIIDVFPPHQQAQIRTQLSVALEGVVSQALVPLASGAGRVAAVEVMVATGAIRNLIREGKTHQIPSAIMSGARDGMQTLNQALRALVEQKKVSYEDAVSASPHEKDLAQLLGRV